MAVMNIRKYLESMDLRDGESRRLVCPSCNAKGTFTVTKEMGQIKYNCYKLDCTVGGYHHTDLTAAEVKLLLSKQEKAAPKEAETMEIPEYVVQPGAEHDKFWRFVKRWGIASTALLYDVKDERVVFPIHWKGRIIDANGRAVGGKIPKWYRYSGKADYFLYGSGTTLLVVEDCTSAMIAAQELPTVTAMAILGTSLTPQHMAKIAEYDRVVVALDPDAAHKTLLFKRDIALWTGADAVAFRLDDDIKYRLDDDIERLKELLS
jgi:hypothetical protein